MSSSASGRKRVGQQSRYVNGGENSLVRRPPRPRENLEQIGAFTPAQLVRMEADFCARMERAIARGLERRPERRITCTFRGRSAA